MDYATPGQKPVCNLLCGTWGLRKTALHKCAVVPRRARIEGSKTLSRDLEELDSGEIGAAKQRGREHGRI